MKSIIFLTLSLFLIFLEGNTQPASSVSVIRYGTDSVVYFKIAMPYIYNGTSMKQPSYYKAISSYKVYNCNDVFLKNTPGKNDFLSQYNQCLSCKYKYAQQINSERSNKNTLAHHMRYTYGEPLFYSYDQHALYSGSWYTAQHPNGF